MEVVRITPRGFCYGVVDAMEMAKKLAADPAVPQPVYILGMIVHNQHVVDDLHNTYGIVTLDGPDRMALLEQIPIGAAVVFTAHGVSPAVKAAAAARGLTWYDATCPDVIHTHKLVRDLVAKGYHIIYLGKQGHPESDGVIGEAPDHVHLVESTADIDALALPATPLAVTTQSTMSQWDTLTLIEHITSLYPHVEIYNEICLATQRRQEAAVAAAGDVDAVVVVGDRRSNNSKRLVQVIKERTGTPAYLVDSRADICPEWFSGCRRVAVTSGSSTPTHLTREVVEFLEQLPAQGGTPSE